MGLCFWCGPSRHFSALLELLVEGTSRLDALLQLLVFEGPVCWI